MALTIFSFRPAAVTLLLTTTYISLLTSLLFIHLIPPPAGSSYAGTNLTTAWTDLRTITTSYHPYNSRANDAVRSYLLARLRSITASSPHALVIDDNTSNIHFRGSGHTSVYFEGTNIAVAIKGTREDLSPVLVNAHYDSVSTGYGATDDGVAVVVALQVVEAMLARERPQRGVIVLLNNGEEDYLNGARAWAVNPLSRMAHSFLNLEGAGAGGRAVLFRSTDVEVTRWYANAKEPFGTVVAGDGFKQGLIRSQTDYKVFVEDLGMRGLDVAFWTPRSRYHTEDDDVRHTSLRSVGHMLGLALDTLAAATSDVSGEFDQDGKAGVGKDAVWFDSEYSLWRW